MTTPTIKDWAKKSAALDAATGRTAPASAFPASVTFEGKRFARTGKVGTNAKTGEPSAEYRWYGESGHEDDRVWRTLSGKVARD